MEREEEENRLPMKDRCKHSALKFFKEIMHLEIDIEDIWKAHRMGAARPNKVKPMVLKISYAAKDLVMENLSKLKNLSNPTTRQVYFISEQIPEGILEEKKQVNQRAKKLREINDQKPKADRQNIQVFNNKILIDGEITEPEVQTPKPAQLFLDAAHQTIVDQIQETIVETEPQTIRNSEFMAIAAKVHSIQEVNDTYIAVSQRYPSADHIMLGYAFKEKEVLKVGSCDNGEYGAGARICKMIFEQKSFDTAVFVLHH